LLARSGTSRQDSALFAEVLALPNNGRYATLDEPRASIKLARRKGGPGQRRKARVALAPIVGAFEDGADTAGLPIARALLAELDR